MDLFYRTEKGKKMSFKFFETMRSGFLFGGLISLGLISQNVQSGNSSIPNDLIALATVMVDFQNNQLRALETYGDGAFNIVGVFWGAEIIEGIFADKIRVTMIPDAKSTDYAYLYFDKSERESIMGQKRRTLVVARGCRDLDKQVWSPRLNCSELEKVDTTGMDQRHYLEELIRRGAQ